ncbi:MAG: ABC transporter ATP-binding protein [Lachnospiraceae bacterium]|nr:ABC transporter ATP-binding protein [Lachnospiraceae bacterium]
MSEQKAKQDTNVQQEIESSTDQKNQKDEKGKKRQESRESMKKSRETLAFMMKLAWKKKPLLFLLYALRLIQDVFDRAWQIFLPKLLMDELQLFMSGAEVARHLHNLSMYAVISVTVTVVNYLLRDIVDGHVRSVIREWFQEYIAVDIARQAMEMDFEHTEDPDALDALNKAQEGMGWYSGGVEGVLGELFHVISNILVICGGAGVVLVTCPLLVPVQLVALLGFLYFNMRINRIEVHHFEKLSKENRIFAYFFYQIAEMCYGKDIRLYNSAGMMGKRTDEQADRMFHTWQSQDRQTRSNNWAMDVINTLRDAISYFYIGYLAITHKISLGDFAMCVAAASVLYQSLFALTNGLQQVTKRCNYAHRYLEYLNYPAAMEKGSRSITPGEHTIEFADVSFRYPRAENFVLRHINLTIKSGEHLSIVGLNGAGKTTLVKLLCRLYDVTEGAILIDGVNIKEYSEEEYRRLFAVVFQDFELFAFSLKENVALAGSESADTERIAEILKLTGLSEDVEKLPEGMDTMIFKSYDEHGTELSGGQQQKTAIARALYRNAPIVILDEPTAALDPIAEYEIYRQFETLVGGKTAIYISHRLSSCRFCDRIAVFADDTIKEYGTHDELVGVEGGIYAEMFHEQAKYYTDIA